MANTLSTKDTLRIAVLIGFLAAAAVGGCTGMGEMREREQGSGEGGEDSGSDAAGSVRLGGQFPEPVQPSYDDQV